MPRYIDMKAAIEKYGVIVFETDGWKTRGSATFHPQGVVAHHTGKYSTVAAMENLCIKGRADVPGPLCQVLVDPQGRAHMIAAGRANHAGEGSFKLPTGQVVTSGNTLFIGVEAMHPGDSTPWGKELEDGFHRVCAGLMDFLDAPIEMLIGHKEWAPKRKVDPALDMTKFRNAVWGLMNPVQKDVKPMFDPALVMKPWAAAWKESNGAIRVAASSDGDVYAFGMPHYGNVRGRTWWPADSKVAQIGPRDDGVVDGYMITDTKGHFYRLPFDKP